MEDDHAWVELITRIGAPEHVESATRVMEEQSSSDVSLRAKDIEDRSACGGMKAPLRGEEDGGGKKVAKDYGSSRRRGATRETAGDTRCSGGGVGREERGVIRLVD